MSHSVIAAHLRGTSNGFWRVCRVNSRQPVQYGVQGCQTYNDPHMCTCSDAHSRSIEEPQWVTRSGGRTANAQGVAGAAQGLGTCAQKVSLSVQCVHFATSITAISPPVASRHHRECGQHTEEKERAEQQTDGQCAPWGCDGDDWFATICSRGSLRSRPPAAFVRSGTWQPIEALAIRLFLASRRRSSG